MNWLRKLFVEEDTECLKFLRGLTHKKTPRIFEDWVLSYVHRFRLDFDDVLIEIKYNTTRKLFTLKIYSREAQACMFYWGEYYEKPTREINFLAEKYGLHEMLDKSLEKLKKENQEKSVIVSNVISKYKE